MPVQETGKQRASRISLDYYTKPDLLEIWKLRLGGIAVIAALAWAGAHFAFNFAAGETVHFHASRGPVASVHQAWDAQCSACHVDFAPISSNSWQPSFLRDANLSSQRCQSCHAGPAHHESETTSMTCGSCHRDHRGPEASLVNLPDTDCTQCHKDLSKHMDAGKAWHVKAGEKEIDKKVVKFSADAHPPFRSIAKDTGKLRFNHQRHLAAGMALQDAGKKGDAVKTLGDIPKAYRERYRAQQKDQMDSDAVQLNCASCHQVDSGDFGAEGTQAKSFPFSIQGQRGAGAYMLPIVYDNQCIACHPLEHKVAADKKWTIPHRLTPDDIHDLLNDYFTAQQVREIQGSNKVKITRPLPFKLSPEEQAKLDTKVKKAESELFDEIDRKIQNVEREYFKGNQSCALCHYFEGPKGEPAANVTDRRKLKVAPTKVPQVWFQHAKFDHKAHRGVQCESCHVNATTSVFHQDVLIPDRDNCVQCHAPTTKHGTPGARFNCTECHRYHNGDHAVQGVGAEKRNPKTKQSIQDFLGGR